MRRLKASSTLPTLTQSSSAEIGVPGSSDITPAIAHRSSPPSGCIDRSLSTSASTSWLPSLRLPAPRLKKTRSASRLAARSIHAKASAPGCTSTSISITSGEAFFSMASLRTSAAATRGSSSAGSDSCHEASRSKKSRRSRSTPPSISQSRSSSLSSSSGSSRTSPAPGSPPATRGASASREAASSHPSITASLLRLP